MKVFKSSKMQIAAAFAAVYLIWGSTYLAIRFVIETIPAFLSAGLRFLVAGLVLYFFARFKRHDPPPQKEQWKAAFIVGALLLLGGNGCVVWSEYEVPSGLAALFIALVPLWMVLLEWWWHQTRRPSMGVFIGIAIGFVGVWLLMAPDFFHHGRSPINLGGALLLLIASVSWSIGSVYSRRAKLPASSLLSTGMQMIGGGALLMMVGIFRGEFYHFHIQNFSMKSMLSLIYLVMFGSLLGYTAYLWLLKHVGVARTSTYAFVNPLVALSLGWAFAQEKLNIQTAIAAVFVLVAVIIITIYHKHNDHQAILTKK